MQRLLTYSATAARLGCSVSHVRALACAAQLAEKPENDVPPRLRRYLKSGFPRPLILSARMIRIDETALEKWLSAANATERKS